MLELVGLETATDMPALALCYLRYTRDGLFHESFAHECSKIARGPGQILGHRCLRLRKLSDISVIAISQSIVVLSSGSVPARASAARCHWSIDTRSEHSQRDPRARQSDSYVQISRMQSVVPDSLGISVSLAGRN